MPVVDSGQPRPNTDDSSTDDRKGSRNKSKRVRKADPDHYAKWGKANYEKNKAAYIARADVKKKEARAEFAAFKAKLACAKCGENHPATLDFHHVIRKPENKKVYRLVANGMYSAAIKEAVEKCIVLCSNCHRKHHYEEDQIKRGPKPPSINQEG
jgi:hypothetical protein